MLILFQQKHDFRLQIQHSAEWTGKQCVQF